VSADRVSKSRADAVLGLLAHSLVSGAGRWSRTEEGVSSASPPVPLESRSPGRHPGEHGLAEEILAFLAALG